MGQREVRCEIRRFERRAFIMINHCTGSFAPAAGQQHLCLEDFERADIRVAERRFGAGDIIYAPGDPDGQLHFVLGGTVRLYKIYGEYKEATVALLREGDVFGELSLEENSCQNAFAEAVTDVRVGVVRKSVLNEVIKRRPEFALKLFSSFSERLRQSDETIESLLAREVSARLATLLSHLGNRFGEPYGSDMVLKMRLTHQDLANMIFSTREAVSKEMSGFQRAGLIEVRNRRISVTPQLAKRRSSETFSNPGAAA
jgi:CRP/FNR family transcriptional regulator, global nitrogen regulator